MLRQGIALAGEFAGASVFVTEHVPGSRVAAASGFVLGASYIGFFLGAASGALLTTVLPAEALDNWGWRIPFLIGGAFGFASLYLRRQLDETPLFLEIRQTKDRAKAFPLSQILKNHLESVIFDILLGGFLGTMIIILYFYMQSLLQTQYGIDRAAAFNANAAALLLLALVCPLWGRLADKVGYGWVLGLGSFGLTRRSFPFLREPGRDRAQSRTVDLVDHEFFDVHVHSCRRPGALRVGVPDRSAVHRIWLRLQHRLRYIGHRADFDLMDRAQLRQVECRVLRRGRWHSRYSPRDLDRPPQVLPAPGLTHIERQGSSHRRRTLPVRPERESAASASRNCPRLCFDAIGSVNVLSRTIDHSS